MSPELPELLAVTKLKLAQKIAAAATLLAVVVFLFAGGSRVSMWQLSTSDSGGLDLSRLRGESPRFKLEGGEYGAVVRSEVAPEGARYVGECTDWGRTTAVSVGILLAGCVVTFLLGLMPLPKSGSAGHTGQLPPGDAPPP